MKCLNPKRQSDEFFCPTCHKRWGVDEEAPDCVEHDSQKLGSRPKQLDNDGPPQSRLYRPPTRADREKRHKPTPMEQFLANRRQEHV